MIDSSSFYKTEYDGQVRRAYLMLGDLGSAQDAVQDAFVSVLQRWDAIDEPGPYLNRCVLNACRDRASVQLRTSPSVAADFDLPAPADSRMAELWDVMNDLPFNQRAALVLRYFDGHTESQIATILGVRPGTVGPLVTRGLRALRSKISSVGKA